LYHLERSFIKDTIPSSLGLLSQLRVIRLSKYIFCFAFHQRQRETKPYLLVSFAASNTIFGTIPLELWNLQGLEELYLGMSTIFSVSICRSMQAKYFLLLLKHAGRNNLEGSIPSKFSNSNLTNLYLGM
jgi:hypothetical protein